MGLNVNQNLEALCDKLGEFVSTKTVVGEAITIGDIVLIPLIEVAFGMGAGGNSDTTSKKGGEAGGLGAKITPNAVIAIIDGNVQLINIKNQDAVNKLVDMVPGVVSKLNFGSIFNKNAKEEQDEVKFEEEMFVEE